LGALISDTHDPQLRIRTPLYGLAAALPLPTTPLSGLASLLSEKAVAVRTPLLPGFFTIVYVAVRRGGAQIFLCSIVPWAGTGRVTLMR